MRKTTVGTTIANYVEQPLVRMRATQGFGVGMRSAGSNPVSDQVESAPVGGLSATDASTVDHYFDVVVDAAKIVGMPVGEFRLHCLRAQLADTIRFASWERSRLQGDVSLSDLWSLPTELLHIVATDLPDGFDRFRRPVGHFDVWRLGSHEAVHRRAAPDWPPL